MHVVVLVPTYNEREALPTTIGRLLDAVPEASVVVIDDASPDGTGALADAMASTDSRLSVLHRAAKEGLGAAYIEGMQLALERGADAIVEFDADGSHPASAVPRMLARLKPAGAADLVIGSRWQRGGGVVDWPKYREAISRAGNVYAQICLGSSIRDMTAGCRAYTAELLRTIPLDEVRSQGYSFQIDMTRRVLEAGGLVEEVPITFKEREVGTSKMTPGIIREAFTQVTGWGVGRAARRVERAAGAVLPRLFTRRPSDR